MVSNYILWWRTKSIWLHRENCVIHTVLPMQSKLIMSATALASLKPFTSTNIVSFLFVTKFKVWRRKNSIKVLLEIKIVFSCLAPQKPYNFEILFVLNVLQKFIPFFPKKSWLKKIKHDNQHGDAGESRTYYWFFCWSFLVVGNLLQRYMVSPISFNMGIFWKRMGKNEVKLEIKILTWSKKGLFF